jgi:DNA polymerase
MILFADTETYSPVPISNGLYAYAERVEVMLFSYAIDDEPPQCIDLTQDRTRGEELIRVLLRVHADKVVFHNAQFDRTAIDHSLAITLSLDRLHCTMAQALAHSLPAGLAQLALVLGVPIDLQKDKAGHNLIQLFCRPRPKNQKLRRATRETHPAEWAQFVSYATQDIVSMRECYRRMPVWNYR